MALINCPECDNTVSDKAKSCPHCGFPIKKPAAKNNSEADSSTQKKIRRPNGLGTVYKLSSGRRRPWTARITTGWNEKNHPIYKFIGYYETEKEAENALIEYNKRINTVLSSTMTLKGLYETFLNCSEEELTDQQLAQYNRAYKKSKSLHGRRISSIDNETIEDLFVETEATDGAKRDIKALFKALMSFARQKGIQSDVFDPFSTEILTRHSKMDIETLIQAELEKVDAMTGHQFEYWCADLLKKNGFIKVDNTPLSGDQGVDITAERDEVKFAFQCKCFASDISNKPIQEVNVGKHIYNCHVGVVMTNRYFTKGAKEAAQVTATLLWDRDRLKAMIRNSIDFL